MYLTVIFVVFFGISSGLIPNSELDQLFQELEDKNGKDPSNDIAETASKGQYDNIYEDTFETVGEEIGEVLNNRIWGDSLEIIDEKFSESLPGEPLVRKTRAVKEVIKNLDIPGKTVVKNTEQNKGNDCSCKSVATTFNKVPAVSIFVSNVIKNIQSSEYLTIVFTLTDITPQQYSQLKYRFIVDLCRRYGYPDGNLIAALSIRPITKYFDTIETEALIQVSANFVADVLFAEGILTIDNAEDLALKCGEELEKIAKGKGIDGESGYTSKFQAIAECEIGALLSFGELSAAKMWEMAVYCSHEWLMLAALDYGTLIDLTV